MCPSGVTCLSADCCFSDLAQAIEHDTIYIVPVGDELFIPPFIQDGNRANLYHNHLAIRLFIPFSINNTIPLVSLQCLHCP
jgi:hypothetical protein